ncbi:MAG: hypothetical protein KF895_02755 [Parvibaculum sp.]|nr:hypothetical protein [Parvibaculum sp.]
MTQSPGGNLILIWPVEKLAAAQTYASQGNAHWAANYEPGGALIAIHKDKYGQWVTMYYGPPFTADLGDGHVVIPEPEEMIPLRADGVLHNAWEPWEDDEEEG